VRLIVLSLIALVIAVAVGLGATWATSMRGLSFGGITIGAWSASPRSGTADIDPYARAVVARSGELPIGSGDGIAFIARTDDAGRPLDGRCDITLTGVTPVARFWTLTLYDPQGYLVGNALQRYGFTSQEVVRSADGAFGIRVSPRARSGNWLPTGGLDRYMLVMRLYDTPVGVASRMQRDTPMPSITSVGCP
jgi:hypothetical protein